MSGQSQKTVKDDDNKIGVVHAIPATRELNMHRNGMLRL